MKTEEEHIKVRSGQEKLPRTAMEDHTKIYIAVLFKDALGVSGRASITMALPN